MTPTLYSIFTPLSLATGSLHNIIIGGHRELKRRLRVWERRRREEKRPLLEEWVPPTAGQAAMARALGAARAWEEIGLAQKER